MKGLIDRTYGNCPNTELSELLMYLLEKKTLFFNKEQKFEDI